MQLQGKMAQVTKPRNVEAVDCGWVSTSGEL